MKNQFFVIYDSNKLDMNMFNRETGEYGNYKRFAGIVGSIKAAKSVIRSIKKNHADENPHNFEVYDSFSGINPETGFVNCVYTEQ